MYAWEDIRNDKCRAMRYKRLIAAITQGKVTSKITVAPVKSSKSKTS